jgi:hypothetical protein
MKEQTIDEETIESIASQASTEILNSHTAKQRMLQKDWKLVEELLFQESVAQTTGYILENMVWKSPKVNLCKGFGFIDTLASKLRKQGFWNVEPVEMSDELKAKFVDACKEQDSRIGDWEGKKRIQLENFIKYGKRIYEYYATNTIDRKNYKANLNIVSPYDFFIDPACGSDDIENAFFLGHKTWISAQKLKTGAYREDVVKNYFGTPSNFSTNSQDNTVQALDKEALYRVHRTNNSDIQIYTSRERIPVFKWYTTYEGERYYMLLSITGDIFKICKLTDLQKEGLYPYDVRSTNPNQLVFWTKSPLTQVRPLLELQDVTMELILDSWIRAVKPMKVLSGNLKNPESINQYRPDKILQLNDSGTPLNQIIQTLQTGNMEASIQVFQMTENEINTNGALNKSSRGVAEDKTATLAEINNSNVSDRYRDIDIEFSNYSKLAKLHYHGLLMYMDNQHAVAYTGTDGIAMKKVLTAGELKPGYGYFDFKMANNIESKLTEDQKAKQIQTLISLVQMGGIKNVSYLTQYILENSGMDTYSVQQLMSENAGADKNVIAQLYHDIENILLGVKVDVFEPSEEYIQAFIYWLEKNMNERHITKEQENNINKFKDALLKKRESRLARELVIQQTQMQEQEQEQTPEQYGQ